MHTNDISSGKNFPSNYIVFRKDRILKHGGGKFLACRELHTNKEIYVSNNCEAVISKIT